QIKILTGDSLEVASAVAMQVGIISDLSKAMLGQDFEKLDSLGQHKAVNEIHVFARVTPEQKYKIIQLLEEKYEVGFLGEGINDAPALKTANVSLVVESASDIARETADIILLQKDLKVIIDGIKEGRKVYANNKKYITATLSSNFGNFYAVGVASLLINYLPMLPLQILLVNLLSDFPMIAVATDTVDDADIASPKRYNLKTILIKATFLGVVSTLFDFIFFASFSTISASTLQTSWFIGSILTELVFLFSVRTNKLFLLAKFPSKILVILTAMAATLTVLIPFTSFGRSVFGFTTLTSTNLFMIASIVLGYFLTTEAAKLVFVRTYQRLSTTVAKH
ncbi:MAG: Cation-transporting P-type ATPase, partial [Parcubacteria group bacterium GW2011_GWA1_38_7]